MEQLNARQKENDAYTKEKRELELEGMRIANKMAANPPVKPGVGGAKPKPAAGAGDMNKKGHSYDDKLEQKQHEKIGEGRTKNIKAVEENKKL
jgi:hypothetical protein